MTDADESSPVRIGLALGGGVARGWAHIGAIETLLEMGVEPDIVAGSSIGALVGGCYLAGELETLKEWALSLNRRSLLSYLDLRLRGGGLLAGERLARKMEEYLSEVSIEDLPRPFVAVCAELATGHEAWLREGPMVPALRASYALPGAFAPVKIGGRFLIDGALVNPIPVSVCRALGARLVIAVGLHGDSFGSVLATPVEGEDGDEDVGGVHGALPVNKMRPERLVMRQLFGSEDRSPGLGSVMVGALNLVMDRLGRSRLAGDPPDVYVIPRIAHIGLLEFARAEELIEAGREAMRREAPVLRHALNVLRG
ncbi:MAG: patatin-like phospholipase family protein [Caulobacterales bacterium]|nr:patatin-like phospholipase family protein [Caulobacterales bacterium]